MQHYTATELPPEIIAAYRTSGELVHLHAIREAQAGCEIPSQALKAFFSQTGFIRRNQFGNEVIGRANWLTCYLRVGDVEEQLQRTLRTEGPELVELKMSGNRALRTHDMLLLTPVRNLIEGRNGGLLDAERYYAWGRLDYSDVNLALDGRRENSIFRRYLGDDGRNLCVARMSSGI
ncbi:hypothetical protein [Rhizobium mongolense]|uniref:Uncharacterized protein n=1 Tax=Rhizobium mongolense TaxID=57676 RepID=A0ABR6IYN3_9HYPH|nr:hypothetical protein [Rhizobium mongolense]MBB4232888.1 hypothetical protein [Rhizobium mongolense]